MPACIYKTTLTTLGVLQKRHSIYIYNQQPSLGLCTISSQMAIEVSQHLVLVLTEATVYVQLC